MERQITGKPLKIAVHADGSDGPVTAPPAQTTEVVTRVVIAHLLDPAEGDDLLVVVRMAARLLGISEQAAAVRYHRAVQRLCDCLPGTGLAELEA
jgi:hypothetical protein